MKMRLIPVVYFGFTAMDRRFSSPMLPWIFTEIRKRESQEKLSLAVEDGHLQAYNQDFEVVFSHKLLQMTRFSQADSDPCTFLYLLRDDVEQLLYCYLYQTYKQSDVTELYQQMKEHQRSNSGAGALTPTSASNLTSLCVDISPSCSNFFEVLYIGKIKVWHKKVPETFIDDALDKFKQHDLDKNRRKLARLKSEVDLRRGSVDSSSLNLLNLTNLQENKEKTEEKFVGVPRLQRSHSLLSNLSIKSPDVDRKLPIAEDLNSKQQDETIEEGDEDAGDEAPQKQSLSEVKEGLRKMTLEGEDLEKELEKQLKLDEHNRTMVLQVDRTDLRLISPDRKVILLHKQHKDVATCIQGVHNAEHFGFISREASNPSGVATYIGFVFKCESPAVSSEAVAAITQAFTNSSQSSTSSTTVRANITSCDHCPMVWFHKLCCEIETMTERKQQAAILRRVDQLDEDEQNSIMTKYRGVEADTLREQNEFLMMLLRAHCEMKQGRHVHDTAENRSEFLNQYLGNAGAGTIFMKAKRSLSNSFDHLLKRRGSRDDFATVTVASASRESSPNTTHTLDIRERQEQDEKSLKSPMMDIFMKVGSNQHSAQPQEHEDHSSWRQAIFKKVITPKPAQLLEEPHKERTSDELRQLWKKSIHQAILLIRMEKENARIRLKQEESAVKRIKLEYDEMRTGHTGAKQPEFNVKLDVWDLQAIRQGVPRGKRGEVWHQLAEQISLELPPMDINKHPTYNTPYETLLKQLTSHQHAILIDLGRTFPNHSYFSSPLGPGQLALFNLLKAYSLLDPEVGYCQGLSFVAGVLLLHMDEPSAFFMLRHLMFCRQLRNQYLPDMVGLQIKLYQLSRLLRDNLPDVYAHLDRYEVAPTLYAAPWLLTIFASQFPLGFVTRVFDLIFLENTDVIFRVILALLMHHRSEIIHCDSFEDIMTYFKVKLPQIDRPALLDTIMNKVYDLDIAKQLAVYQVEYNVLQEEMQSIHTQLDTLARTEQQLRHLKRQNKSLEQQLELALGNVERLEQTRAVQQGTISKLDTNNKHMDVTIVTLGNYLINLMKTNPGINVPGDVRRVLGQLPSDDVDSSFKESSPSPKSKNLFNLFNKSQTQANPNRLMVKSLSTGRIAIPTLQQDVLRANSINTRKTSAFFSDTHKDILMQTSPSLNPSKSSEYDLISPTNSTDSGVVTPSKSTNSIVNFDEAEEDSLNNNRKGPPLSHSDINVTYNTRELKKVKSVREMTPRNSPGPDIVK